MNISDPKVSIEQAAKMILASPKTPFFLQGSPGVGKTFATATALREAGYSVEIVSCQNVAPEDAAALPVVRDGTLTFACHKKWIPRPKMAIILDEFSKASDEVMNTFLPLIFGRPRQFLENDYGDDMIVVLTGNSGEFRAGDSLKPHHRNRIVQLNIADPTPASALAVALTLGWDSRVIQWATNNPAALVSWDEEMVTKPDSENVDRYFGYDPRFPNRPFVSMRSLETVSLMLTSFEAAGMDLFECRSAYAGAMGSRATQSFLTDLRKTGEFIPFASIVADPLKAKIPNALYDQRMVALSCASNCNEKNWNLVLDYIDRMHSEIRDVFCLNVNLKKPLMERLVRHKRWNSMVTAVAS
jgi:hypothetical protein